MGRKNRGRLNHLQDCNEENLIDLTIDNKETQENTIENENQEEIVCENEKIENCKVIFIKDKSLVIDFKGYGINIKTHGIIDKDLIPKYIDVRYESDIGKPDFKYFPIFK